MNQHTFTVAYSEVESENFLPLADRELLIKAWEACELAYAPYSHFHVGASLRLTNGLVFIGNNQENSAYPSGLCAERVVVFSASAQQPGVPIESVAIVAKTSVYDLANPVTPCGACRQVMAEYEKLAGKPIRVLLQGKSGKVWIIDGIDNLLPLMFDGAELKK